MVWRLILGQVAYATATNLPIDFGKFGEINMGGYNSGKRGGKYTTDDMRSLDIRRLKRDGLLTPGRSFMWNWTRHKKLVASIHIFVDAGSALLTYQQSWRGGEWRHCSNAVQIEWTECNFGGQRAWWCCPGTGCGKRVAVLYSSMGRYSCRHCLHLAYRSQRETPTDLAARRADKIRDRLGWDRGILNSTGGRPKGMHWKTYLRLLEEHRAHSMRALAGFERYLQSTKKQLRRL